MNSTVKDHFDFESCLNAKMGCTPSKGKLFSKLDNPGTAKALLPEEPQVGTDSQPVEDESKFLKTEEEEENEISLPGEVRPIEETAWSQAIHSATAAQNTEDIKDTQLNVTAQEIVDEDEQRPKNKKTKKRKKNKGKREGKRRSSRNQESSMFRGKLDFPPYMLRAHQAAYAFLNPNISKYETLLGLLDQAAQTQLSLQPMMSALVLRFEEIYQALEEMAEEGELMMKEYGDYMALPSGMMGAPVIKTKPTTAMASPPDPPPDLLQELLQHSTEKMRHVGSSVKALGDTTLEEAVEYFSSLSKLLAQKLQAKQAVEQRLAQVLAQVEGAALRKSNPEDSALHSEDSGIGGENESLTGLERHRHRGSAGSANCGFGINIRGAFDTVPSNSSNLVGHNEDDEEDEEEDDDEDEEYEDTEDDRPERKRSNSFPPGPSQSLLYMCSNYLKEQQPTVKRPLTAIATNKPEHSSSTSCVHIKMELRNSQRNLDQQIKKMTTIQGSKDIAGPHYNLYRVGLRRHSLSGSAVIQKGPFRENSPCPLPILAPQPPKRQSVRRLINTFSHGVDGRPGEILANIPPHIRRPRKTGLLLLSDEVNANEGSSAINGNNNNNSWPDSRDDLDVDNLPPPPPEVLMDNSFQSTESMQGNEGTLQQASVRSLPVIIQNTGVSQRLKASVQNVELLPSRASVRPRSVTILPARSVRQDAVMGAQDVEQKPDTDLDLEMEKGNCPYQQAHKIIHLPNAIVSPDNRNLTELSSKGPSSLQAKMGQRCEPNEFYEGEISSCSLPVTAPPVSRVRLPPSCPSVCHRYPSPPVFRSQTTSRPLSRPGSPRTVTRATDENTEVIIPSVSFRDARSVFCLNELQNQTSTGHSTLPRSWGEASRGRLPMRRVDNSARRTQSEKRSCLTSDSEFSKDSKTVSGLANDTESVTMQYR